VGACVCVWCVCMCVCVARVCVVCVCVVWCVCVCVCVCGVWVCVFVRVCVWNNAGLSSFRRLIYDRSVGSSIAVTCSSCFLYMIICADYGSLAILIALVMQVRIFSAVSIDLFTYFEMTLTYFRCIRHQQHIKLK